MLKAILNKALDRFESRYYYDVSYSRYILSHSLLAFRKLARLTSFSQHHEGLPTEVLYAAKITSAMQADCGPCTQLMVTWAEEARVCATVIHAVLTRDHEFMSDDVRLAVKFVEASLARDLEADALRERIRAKWGDNAVITMAFAITAGQIFPTLKYALGFGHACTLVKVAGKSVQVSRDVPKILQEI